MDRFDKAQRLAFDIGDVELEAKCEALLGKIYLNYIGKANKAIVHFRSVERLVLTLYPKDMNAIDWYRQSKASFAHL